MSRPSRQTVSSDQGAVKLLSALGRAKDLPIEPLDRKEWDFSECPTWERARCWDYETWREWKSVRANVRQWREEFPNWVEERLRQDREGDGLHLGLTRRQCEDMYDCLLPKWLLHDFPEFPEQPYLGIEKCVRKERLAKLGCTAREPRQIIPLDTIPVAHMLGELAKESSEFRADDLPNALANPQAHLAEWRARIAAAFQKDDFTFSRHKLTWSPGRGGFITDVVLRVPWYESKKRLLKRFAALLEKLEKELPDRPHVLGGRGSTTPGDWLKKLGAFRLLRHCRGNWKLAADMSARAHPSEKALFENQATWNEANLETAEFFQTTCGSGNYDPVR